jgi:hypothetical protein
MSLTAKGLNLCPQLVGYFDKLQTKTEKNHSVKELDKLIEQAAALKNSLPPWK